jgi:UPF0716 protein FxsA
VVLVLVLLFVVLPIVEIFVIIKVAGAIGGWDTLGLLIASSIVGAYLVRHEGWTVMRRVRDQLDRGVMPAREVIDGVLVLAGGVLMIVPGFVTDGVGLLLLFPPTRVVARTALIRRYRNRIDIITPRRRGGGPHERGPDGHSDGPPGVIDV